MAGNYKKFIDRNPIISAAGKQSGDPNLTLAKCLRYYSTEDKINALKNDVKLYDKRPTFIYPLPPLDNCNRHSGTYTRVGQVINPEVKNNFEHLIDELKETNYNSYWKLPVGKSKDPRSGLPAGLDYKNCTFGIPSKKCTTVKELVNPPKTYTEVFLEADNWHENYVFTHNDYNPGEQINRNYMKPPFDQYKLYGEKNHIGKGGIFVKKCVNWFNNKPVCIVDEKLAKRNKKQIYTTNEYCLRNDIKIKQDSFGVKEILQNAPTDSFKTKLGDWIKHSNKIRFILKKRLNPVFDPKEFLYRLKYYDNDKTSILPKHQVYEVCKEFNVSFNRSLFEPFMEYLEIMKNDMINFKQFCDLIDPQKEYPDMLFLKDIPEEYLHYKTTSQAAAEDYKSIDNSGLRPAGTDFQESIEQNVNTNSTMRSCINPSIFTVFGVNHIDFFQIRTKKDIRDIFEGIGFKMNNAEFEELWNEASKQSIDGFVCVETFRNVLNNRSENKKCNCTENDI